MSHCFTPVTCFPLLVTSTSLGTVSHGLSWVLVSQSHFESLSNDFAPVSIITERLLGSTS